MFLDATSFGWAPARHHLRPAWATNWRVGEHGARVRALVKEQLLCPHHRCRTTAPRETRAQQLVLICEHVSGLVNCD